MCKSKRIKSEQTTRAPGKIWTKKRKGKSRGKLEQTMQPNAGATEWHLKALPGRALNMLGVMGMPNPAESWSRCPVSSGPESRAHSGHQSAHYSLSPGPFLPATCRPQRVMISLLNKEKGIAPINMEKGPWHSKRKCNQIENNPSKYVNTLYQNISY